MKLISFGRLTFSSLLSFLLIIFLLVNYYLGVLIEIKANNSILFCHTCSISAILGGLPKIILDLYHTFTSKKKINKKKSKYTYVTNKANRTQIIMIILVMICFSLFNIFQNLFILSIIDSNLFDSANYISFLSSSLTMILITYYSPFAKMNLHHYIAIIFICIGRLIVCYDSFFYGINIIIHFFLGVTFGLILSCIKYFMEKKYIHPLAFIFYYGIIYLILLWFICLICYNTGIYDGFNRHIKDFSESLQSMFSTFKSGAQAIINLLILIVINAIYYSIIYYESPLICLILQCCSQCLIDCINVCFIDFKGNTKFYLNLIGSVFVIIGTLLLIEIANIHCCGLDENTKDAIELRSCEEIDNNVIDMMINDDDELK